MRSSPLVEESWAGLTAEGAAWCVWGLSLALAVVGVVLWFLNRDLGGAVMVPHLLPGPGLCLGRGTGGRAAPRPSDRLAVSGHGAGRGTDRIQLRVRRPSGCHCPRVAARRMAAGGDRGLDVAAQLRWPWVSAVAVPRRPAALASLATCCMGAGRLYCLAHHRNQQLARRNRSERTIATDLIGVRQADAFLRANGTILEAATRPTRCGAGSG